MPELTTLNDVFFLVAAANRDAAVLTQNAQGGWQAISGNQIYQRVRVLAGVLREWGIGKGDRIAILSENRWEWAVTDFAALAIGAVDVPIYPTLTAEQTCDLLADSGARVAVVSTREQYEKVARHRDRTALEHLIIMDDEGTPDAEKFSFLIGEADKATGRDAAFDREAYEVLPEDLATLIYTSGTTGEPKGVRLTHGNIAVQYQRVAERVRDWRDGLLHLVSCRCRISRRGIWITPCTRGGATVAYCGSSTSFPRRWRR